MRATTRLIRITECAVCPHHYQDSLGFFCHFGDGQAPMCPPTGTPDWCPLEKLEEGK